MHALWCFAFAGTVIAGALGDRNADLVFAAKAHSLSGSASRLAVVVPAHGGDLERTAESLARWPTECSSVTLEHADLVLYYAGNQDNMSTAIMPTLAETAGLCFANTRIIYANLKEEVRNIPRQVSGRYPLMSGAQGSTRKV